MDVSHTEHSHVIGKGGNNIKRVMEETGCHIHFPDSNRNNQAEKSNQVCLAAVQISDDTDGRSELFTFCLIKELLSSHTFLLSLEPQHCAIAQLCVRCVVLPSVFTAATPPRVIFFSSRRGCLV